MPELNRKWGRTGHTTTRIKNSRPGAARADIDSQLIIHKEKNINYISAFDELQMIVKEIESGDISVDELSEKVKRASTLIAICKEKLFRTEDDVNQILKDLEAE